METKRKRLTGARAHWVAEYEAETGFECLRKDELAAGKISFLEFAERNLKWLEDHYADTQAALGDALYRILYVRGGDR